MTDGYSELPSVGSGSLDGTRDVTQDADALGNSSGDSHQVLHSASGSSVAYLDTSSRSGYDQDKAKPAARVTEQDILVSTLKSTSVPHTENLIDAIISPKYIHVSGIPEDAQYHREASSPTHWTATYGLESHLDNTRLTANASGAGEVPDHPCNYCKTYHWFAGPQATSCPEGTRLPKKSQNKSPRSGHLPRSARIHLPDSDCVKCHSRHWFAGPMATPCVGRTRLANHHHAKRESGKEHANDHQEPRGPKPERACTYCAEYHWITGPNRSACDPVARKLHHQELKYQRRRHDSFYTLGPSSPGMQDIYTVDDEQFERGHERSPAITRDGTDLHGRGITERALETPYDPYIRPPKDLAVVDHGRDRHVPLTPAQGHYRRESFPDPYEGTVSARDPRRSLSPRPFELPVYAADRRIYEPRRDREPGDRFAADYKHSDYATSASIHETRNRYDEHPSATSGSARRAHGHRGDDRARGYSSQVR